AEKTATTTILNRDCWANSDARLRSSRHFRVARAATSLIRVDRALGDLEEHVLELALELRLAAEVVHLAERDDLALEHDADPVGEVLRHRQDVGRHED